MHLEVIFKAITLSRCMLYIFIIKPCVTHIYNLYHLSVCVCTHVHVCLRMTMGEHRTTHPGKASLTISGKSKFCSYQVIPGQYSILIISLQLWILSIYIFFVCVQLAFKLGAWYENSFVILLNMICEKDQGLKMTCPC